MMYLGIDIGAKRSGVAISESGIATRQLALLEGEIQSQVDQLIGLVHQHKAETIVLGRPRSDRADHPARIFAKLLDEAKDRLANQPKVVFIDETLTTKEAERQAGRSGSQADTDLIAAQLILEQYLREQEPYAE